MRTMLLLVAVVIQAFAPALAANSQSPPRNVRVEAPDNNAWKRGDTNWAAPLRLILVDSLRGQSTEAIVSRGPGQPDEVFVAARHLSPPLIRRAIHQVKVIRALQGEVATTPALFRVGLDPKGRDPDAEMKRTAAGRSQIDREMYEAKLLFSAVQQSEKRHKRDGIGEGRFVDVWLRRVVRKP